MTGSCKARGLDRWSDIRDSLRSRDVWLALRFRQRGQPGERRDTRQGEALAAADGDEPRKRGQAPPQWLRRNRESAGAVIVADQRVPLGAQTGEVAVVHPDLLHELELPGEARSQEDED